MRKKLLVILTAVSLLFLGGVPAQAVLFGNKCDVVPGSPWTNGTLVYSKATGSCSTITSDRLVTLQASVQEKVGLVWTNRGTPTTIYHAGTTYLTVQNNFNCNGHGTDNWRGRASARTNTEKVATAFSASKSLTC